MALTPESQTALVTNFQGSSQSVDPYQVDAAHGLLSQNVDFILGQPFASYTAAAGAIQAASRRGTSQVAQIPSGAGAITTLESWYFSFAGSQNCYVAMYSPSEGILFYDQSTGTFSGVIISVTGAAYASVVFDGLRAYVAFGDFTGRKGVSQGYVYGLFANDTFTNPAVDLLLAAGVPLGLPGMNYSLASVVDAVGVITPGTHHLAFVFTTRNGYTGALSPVDSSGVFAPQSINPPSAGRHIEINFISSGLPGNYFNPSNAPFAPIVQVAMSPVANPAAYYLVPGAIFTIPATPFSSSPLVVNISDADLVLGTNVTQSQNLLTQDQSGNGPFSPSALFFYSSRLAYVTLDPSGFPVVFFSDVNAYQVLRLADSGVYLEGRKIPVQGCSLGGVCYIATLDALYATQDNGGVPATWTQPARVAGSVGILAPSCMRAVGGKLLMASEKGLYVYYGGTFPQVPISYWQSADWNRINWLQPTQVQVIDDAFDHVIRVIAPLSVIITAASNTNPIVLTTAILINGKPVAYPHNFQTGLSVTITGVLGNTAANTTQNITVTGLNTFFIPVAGNGAYTLGGIATPNRPNVEMSWAYPQGDAPGQTFYSLNAFTLYRQASIATVKNIQTNEDEPWYGPASSNPGNIIRRVLPNDLLIHRDVDLSGTAAAINDLYETALAPGQADDSMTIHDFHGMHARISGAGSLALTAYGLDHTVSVVPAASPITLNAIPGKEYLLKWFLRSEQQSIMFGTNAVDAYFIAALLRVYYQGSLPQR